MSGPPTPRQKYPRQKYLPRNSRPFSGLIDSWFPLDKPLLSPYFWLVTLGVVLVDSPWFLGSKFAFSRPYGCDVWMPHVHLNSKEKKTRKLRGFTRGYLGWYITKVYMGLIKGPPFEGYHHFPPKKASKSLGSFLHLDLELPKVKAKGSMVFSTKCEMNEDWLQNETC